MTLTKKSKKPPAGKAKQPKPEKRQPNAAAPSSTPVEETLKSVGRPANRSVAKTNTDEPKRLGALDAAAQVLSARGEAMRTSEMIVVMAEEGLWTSPKGKTPAATLYSAILREIGSKGKESRFRKAERGKFEFAGKVS